MRRNNTARCWCARADSGKAAQFTDKRRKKHDDGDARERLAQHRSCCNPMVRTFLCQCYTAHELFSLVVDLLNKFSVKDNPPAQDGLTVEVCERIITSLLLEKVIATDPIWNAYE